MRHERTIFTFVAAIWLALLASASIMAYTWIEDAQPDFITLPQQQRANDSTLRDQSTILRDGDKDGSIQFDESFRNPSEFSQPEAPSLGGPVPRLQRV